VAYIIRKYKLKHYVNDIEYLVGVNFVHVLIAMMKRSSKPYNLTKMNKRNGK
jgi:hypothetical protein